MTNFWKECSRVAGNLGLKWLRFFSVLFDPWTLLLLATAATSLWFSYTAEENLLSAFLSIAASVFTAALGYRIHKALETELLVARGRSAIRNLKGLSSSITALMLRVKVYLERLPTEECDKEVMKTYLEEVREKCKALEWEAVGAIEHWMDVIPEADVTTQIDALVRTSKQLTESEEDRKQLAERLKEIQTKEVRDSEQVSRLTVQLAAKQAEVQQYREKLAQQETSLGKVLSTSAEGIYPTYRSLADVFNPFRVGISVGEFIYQCPHCSKQVFTTADQPCPHCGKPLTG